MEVKNKMVVSLRYTMKNDRGEVLENIMNDTGVEYLHGSGNILPELEKGVEGLTEGEKRMLSVAAGANSGDDTIFYFDVVIDKVRAATDEELKKGRPIQKNAANECGPGCCC